MVNLTIDNKPVSVPEGTTILQAAATVGIPIPTLCYYKDLNEIGACRVCVVEVTGENKLCAACNSKVYEGMDYAVEDSGLEALFAGPTDEERLHAAIRQLSPDQQEMVRAIYFENVSVNDYAARTGVTQSAISHRLQTVKKKLKKLLG